MAKKDNEKKSVKEIFEENHIAIAELIMSKLGDDMSWDKPWDGIGIERYLSPMSGATGKPYTGCNRLTLGTIAWVNGWTDNRWYTRKQIKENGWKLKENVEKYMVAGCFQIVEHYGKKWCLVDENHKILKMGWGEPRVEPDDGQKIHTWIAAHHFTGVWNANEIEGIELLSEPEKIDDFAVPVADRLIESSLCPVSEGRGDRACWTPVLGIRIPHRSQFRSIDEFVSTLAHEMTHSTGPKLGRSQSFRKGSPAYAKEELVAEFGALFVCADLGIDFSHKVEREGNSAAYIASWFKRTKLKDKAEAIYKAAALAEKASKLILERYGKEEAEDAA